ncbi:MAG: hypothetical protein LC777_03935 [Actinobacteria bacterium]|nr:hypothetical protein [Actinomycetota bacterium]
MSTTEAPVRGKRIRMATYTADVGERQIVGQRVDGEVRLYAEPARDSGRRWVIERGVESKPSSRRTRRERRAGHVRRLASLGTLAARCPLTYFSE